MKEIPSLKLTAKVKAPENGCLEDDPFFLEGLFQGCAVGFRVDIPSPTSFDL